MKEAAVTITAQKDVVAARKTVRDMARSTGLGLADQTRLATAVSELTRNVIQFAGEGICVVSDASDATHMRIRVRVEDDGPGIPDIEQALKEGFGTGRGIGAGLPGVQRIVHRFDITSRPGKTIVTIETARRRS